eukprot:CAMPEP_0113480928 /NCGR_PEP_ID=MMETSP0014_2-20120614/22135_1 /TAXON_ID=2857 /ORGANISM="Nitzschia sp." /LENGTH=301 /DNA_ID=CAMNT_0000374387 /DNA_START=18 /DNA_END=926 /DNA_ORIENTATION=+ /assembly_acc=CAM_ASM_000159
MMTKAFRTIPFATCLLLVTVNGFSFHSNKLTHQLSSLLTSRSVATTTGRSDTTTTIEWICHDNSNPNNRRMSRRAITELAPSRFSSSSSKTFFSPVLRSLWLSMIIAGGVCTSNNFASSFDTASTIAHAAATSTTILSGTVINPTTTSSSSTAAVYVTARPNTPDNVPAAILSGTRGKSPPVLAARFSQPTFPFQFDLVVPDNLTSEGAAVVQPSTATTPTPDDTVIDLKKLWWSADDLIVSVRLDQDGVASTRSPDDLVGRGLWKNSNKNSNNDNDDSYHDRLEVRLEGRGAFGKLVTGG